MRERPLRRSATLHRDRARPIAAAAAALALAITLPLASGCGRRTADPTPTQAVTPTPTPAIVSPATLKSYRYTIALTVSSDPSATAPGAQATPIAGTPATTGTTPAAGATGDFTIQITGEVVNPDREHSETKASLGFIQLTVERIQIGNEAWTREAGGPWKSATPGADTLSSLAGNVDISPSHLFAEGSATFAAMTRQLRTLAFTTDTVDGIATRRYDLNTEQFQQIFESTTGLIPGQTGPVRTSGSLWVGARLRVPIRLRLESTTPGGQLAFTMDMKLSDLNADLAIRPPVER